MTDVKLEIGDIVTHLLTGAKYEIVADKNTPYDPTFTNIYPNSGCDFILGKTSPKERVITPLLHSSKDNLKLSKRRF